MSKKNSGNSRRKLLKSVAVGSGAIVAGKSLPEGWSKPIIDSVMLPAHASTTDDTGSAPGNPTTTPRPCTEPELLSIEFQYPYSGAGDSPAYTSFNMFIGDDPLYVTAWGYYADAPTTPVYINTQVIWASSNTAVAHTGSGPSIIEQQSSSSITAVSPGTATISATMVDLCRGTRVTAEYTVTVEDD